MKHILLLLVCLGGLITSVAASPKDSVAVYRVKISVGGSLNIRQKPTTQSPVIVQTINKTRVNVVDTVGEWVKVELGEYSGYAKMQYIEKEMKPASYFKTIEERLLPWSNHFRVWMTVTLLVIALVLWIAERFFEDEDGPQVALSLLLSVAIIVYVSYLGNNSTWFLNPQKSGGWGWVILHGILFLFLILAHFLGVWKVFRVLKDDWCGSYMKTPNLTLGVVSLVLVFIAIAVCTFFTPEYLWWAVGIFVLLQGIQAAIVYKYCRILGTIVYVVTILASFLLLIPAAVVGSIAMIVFLVLYLIHMAPAGGGIAIPTSSGSSSGSDSRQEEDNFERGKLGDSFSGPCIRSDDGKVAYIHENEGDGYVRTDKGRFRIDDDGYAKKVP
ncbi:MAG: SH3 domain-containing protein [Bacteroides sp.]|nr:SH3 domain-containing protein [Bacteroides sp.]